MRTLYFDCFSGASGDMILGALIDAGASATEVEAELERLGVPGWRLDVEAVTRGGLRASRAMVATDEEAPRAYRDIRALLESSALRPSVARRALKAFAILAGAEARVHGIPADDVHFHEIGGLDAIVDIVGSCCALELLGPERVITSPIAAGRGVVGSSHGLLPVPAPAVTEILRGAVLVDGGEGETITPTGAALVASFSDAFGAMPAMRLEATGYGAGDRDTPLPNVVRVLVGESVEDGSSDDRTLVVESNLDDMSPEMIPYVVDSLLAAGAQDAWITPIVMKKGRPAYTVSALFSESDRDRIVDVIYRETTTLGVRIHPVFKDELLREWAEVRVEGHSLRVKLGRLAGQVVTASPEHEDAVRVARATGMPLKEVYAQALRAATERIEKRA